MLSLDIIQIKESILQRYPFLMVDKIIELVPGERVVAVKNTTINEAFFQGHFPQYPLMPGVLIVEAMAQTSMFLFYKEGAEKKKLDFYLGIIKKMKFVKPVLPGDQLMITAEPLRLAERSASVKVKACVDGFVVAQGELLFVRRDQ